MSSPYPFDEYQQVRYEKLQALRAAGIDPYPPRSERSHSSAEAIALAPDDAASEPTEARVTVAGRVVAVRIMGKAAFATLEDGAGRIQLYLQRDVLGEQPYGEFRKLVDLGDIVQATGPLFRTRTGEPTVRAEGWTMLAKALSQPPEKHHGLTDPEARYRQRYLDLLSNAEVRDLFIKRSRLVSLVRQYMEQEGYIEVETPILQPLYGGGAAQPFTTHHNWAKADMYLRIADELYLKRLIVGGLERVYEIGKDFRNEGLSHKHNPEFTMLEAYRAYADYRDMMALAEGCWSWVCQELLGTTTVTFGEHTLNFAAPWPRITMQEAILEFSGVDIYEATTLEALQGAIRARGLSVAPKATWGTQVDELFSEVVEPRLIQPTFLLDYPREISPLAKAKPDNPTVVERFEFFVAGMEMGNAFTELNDPLEQRERFLDQHRQRQQGDSDAHPIDEDYVTALMHAMPPTGGIGWGIDRMTMVMTGQSTIREVILFPQLRPAER